GHRSAISPSILRLTASAGLSGQVFFLGREISGKRPYTIPPVPAESALADAVSRDDGADRSSHDVFVIENHVRQRRRLAARGTTIEAEPLNRRDNGRPQELGLLQGRHRGA